MLEPPTMVRRRVNSIHMLLCMKSYLKSTFKTIFVKVNNNDLMSQAVLSTLPNSI